MGTRPCTASQEPAGRDCAENHGPARRGRCGDLAAGFFYGLVRRTPCTFRGRRCRHVVGRRHNGETLLQPSDICPFSGNERSSGQSEGDATRKEHMKSTAMSFMSGVRNVSIASIAACIMSAATGAHAQQPVGQCFDQMRAMSFTVFADGMFVQNENRGNLGPSWRDPSGQMYLRIHSIDPRRQAHFVSWSGQLVEIDYNAGVRILGFCQLPIPSAPNWHYAEPQMSNWGVLTPAGRMPLPQALVDESRPYAPIMYATEGRAASCLQLNSRAGELDRVGFGDCMVKAMVGQNELAAYNCVRANSTPQGQAFCMIGALGGKREQEYAEVLQGCHRQYGNDWSRYPLCMSSLATQNTEAGKILACVEQQSRQGNVTALGTATCYGASQLNINTEAQIAVQCAMATGGEPYAFAACAGGQLTARELDKCLSNGVGGPNGCFGPNNTIVQALAQTGEVLSAQFGPNSLPVQTWKTGVRELQNGSRNGAQVLQNVGNEIGRASNNVGKAISRALPRITL
jgi:hypothetical protein